MLLPAAALHLAIIFGVDFNLQREHYVPPSLDVILVDQRTDTEPDDAEYLAAAAQDGGGQQEDHKRPASPFAATEDFQTDGIAPSPTPASSPHMLQSAKTEVLTQMFSDYRAPEIKQQREITETLPAPESDTLQRSLEIARLSAEIHDSLERYARKPRKMFVTARTKKATAANYMLKWVDKVERIGNLNYPAIAKSGINGTL